MNDYSKLNKVSLEIRNQVEEREHFHQDIELIYVLDGAMTVEVGNQKSELKAEDILVINANKKHWLRTNDKDILYLRLGIAYQLVSDVFQSVDIIFWCDSSKENDKRYEEVRKVLKELLGQYLKGGQTEVSFGYISLCYKVLDIMALQMQQYLIKHLRKHMEKLRLHFERKRLMRTGRLNIKDMTKKQNSVF